MDAAGSLAYGHAVAGEYAERALAVDEEPMPFFEDNDDRRFLREMLNYVVERVR
jgi:hypothetical protein